MSASTIKRALGASNPLEAGIKHEHGILFSIKSILYQLVTFGLGKSLEVARTKRRCEEVTRVAQDILVRLPDYARLEHINELTLHSNKDYEIVVDKYKLVLYSQSLFGRGERYELADLSSSESYADLINRLGEVKTTGEWRYYLHTCLGKVQAIKYAGVSLVDNLDALVYKCIRHHEVEFINFMLANSDYEHRQRHVEERIKLMLNISRFKPEESLEIKVTRVKKHKSGATLKGLADEPLTGAEIYLMRSFLMAKNPTLIGELNRVYQNNQHIFRHLLEKYKRYEDIYARLDFLREYQQKPVTQSLAYSDMATKLITRAVRQKPDTDLQDLHWQINNLVSSGLFEQLKHYANYLEKEINTMRTFMNEDEVNNLHEELKEQEQLIDQVNAQLIKLKTYQEEGSHDKRKLALSEKLIIDEYIKEASLMHKELHNQLKLLNNKYTRNKSRLNLIVKVTRLRDSRLQLLDLAQAKFTGQVQNLLKAMGLIQYSKLASVGELIRGIDNFRAGLDEYEKGSNVIETKLHKTLQDIYEHSCEYLDSQLNKQSLVIESLNEQLSVERDNLAQAIDKTPYIARLDSLSKQLKLAMNNYALTHGKYNDRLMIVSLLEKELKDAQGAKDARLTELSNIFQALNSCNSQKNVLPELAEFLATVEQVEHNDKAQILAISDRDDIEVIMPNLFARIKQSLMRAF